MSRMVVMIRTFSREIIKAFRPNKVEQLQVNGNTLNRDGQQQVLVYMTLFACLCIFSLFVVSFTELRNGLDVMSAIGMVIATASNGGPGVGSVGPAENFFHLTATTKVFLSFIMIVGRLELFTVLVLFVPSLWKKY